MSLDFVALSFETANARRSSACAVGLVKVINGEVVDRLAFKIKPRGVDCRFDRRAVATHGMTADDVVDAPHWDEISGKVLEFIGKYPVALHKKEFNLEVIDSLAERYGMPYPTFSKFSTAMLTQWVMPGTDAYYLSKSIEALAINAEGVRFRNVEDEALMTAMVALTVAEKVGADSVIELTDRCRTALTTV